MVILEFLKSMIDNFGAAVIVPIIIGIIALFFRVKPQKAFLSALYAGVSLEGISLMVGAFTPIITPLVKNMADAMVNITGVNLNVFDVGWQATIPIWYGEPWLSLRQTTLHWASPAWCC